MTRPNILFIFTDQQTLQAMSCAGNPYVNTPHMDRLAARGVRFENSYCAAPVCGPSRAALVTGRMPSEVGVHWNGQVPDTSIPNMGRVFQQAGYAYVGWRGKWHLPQSYATNRTGPIIPGFDNQPLPDDMPKGLGDETDAYITRQTVNFLQYNAKEMGGPWLLAVSVHNPHDICGWIGRTPVTHANLDSYPPLPDNFGKTDGEAEFVEICRQRKHYGNEQNFTTDWNEAQWRAYLHAYYRMTEQVDQQIGRMLDALEAGGQADNTIIIFTSDHGEGCAAHQWVVKLMLYEEEVKVPLIISWPGRIPEGRVDRTHLASGIDILPTMCDYAGIDAPALSGESLKGVIEQPESQGRVYLVSELAPDPKDEDLHGRMVRTDRFKYMVFSKGHTPEMLFDLENDPGEMVNIAAREDMRPVLQKHRGHLVEWAMRTNDSFKRA